ncbi:hemerythrin domain-containing protein [Acidobacteria bacterium AB60]|nr:hemerythrin domain-containing protein [Acidobacteria bacterium AB60]
MSVQIGAPPDSGFDDPLGMLQDCHRRIEHFLQVLSTVASRARGRALDQEEAAAVKGALHYFRVGGSRHTDDEEMSLFPRLSAHPEAPEATVHSLENEHQHAEGLHYLVDRLFSTWINNRTLLPETQQQLDQFLDQLLQLYTRHIDLEERVLFPAAAKLLNAEQLAAIGEEFRRRRA